MARDIDRSDDFIELGAASAQTRGGGPMPIDENLGWPVTGLGND